MAIEGNHGFWGDLHHPDLTPNQADFSVIGIPYDGLASARKGAALAPERLRYWSRHLTPFSEDRTRLKDLTICDLGDIPITRSRIGLQHGAPTSGDSAQYADSFGRRSFRDHSHI